MGEKTRHSRLTAYAALGMAGTLLLSACGARAGEDGGNGAAAESCVDTEGDTIKIGFINSLSGTMAISETTVNDVLHLAAEQINEDGGVLGKELEIVEEDGQSEPATFSERSEYLLTQECVAAVFGGWTSASRQAMLPVFEGNNGLLFYPTQYEGLEPPTTSSTRAPPPISRSSPPWTTCSRRKRSSRCTWSAPTTSSRAPPT